MKYTESQLRELKNSVPILDIFKEKGFDIVKRGRNYATLCPFHNDKNPSLIITPENNLWNCLGCTDGKTGGDIIEFLMKYEGIAFLDAVKYLQDRNGKYIFTIASKGAYGTSAKRKNDINPVRGLRPLSNGAGTQKLLNRVADFYHSTFKESKEGREYLRKRGITDGLIIETFKIGYSNGTLFKTIPERGEIVESLKETGILTSNNHELFKDCVIFPIFDKNGNTVHIYGRKIVEEPVKHLYLPGGHRGVFNQHILKSYDEIILTESIIDSLSLYQAGIKNTIPCYGINGLTESHIQAFKENNTRSVIILFDGDETGWKASKEIKKNLSPYSFSCKIAALADGEDPNSYLLKHPLEELEIFLYGKTIEPSAPPVTKGLTAQDGFILDICKRKYTIRGIEGTGNRLKVNIKCDHLKKFHIDTVDLYQSKARKIFIKDATLLFKEDPEIIEADIDKIITSTESYISKKKEARPLFTLTDKDRSEAYKFGKSPNLIENILSDITETGYVGEDTNKLISYLAMTSRKMDDPLSILIISGSGAGKSSLQDTILNLCPPEELVKLTSLTGKALFYKKECSLSHKVLAVEEEQGAEDADYAIRNLISSRQLTIEATVKDMVTGKMTTMENTVLGPTAVFKTTTSPETDPETKSRFLILSIDESREQTRKILDYQRYMDTKEGYLKKIEEKSITKKHRNFQRALRPLTIFNPYAKLLTYLDDRLLVRRDHQKYKAIIKAIAFIHQFAREIKTLPGGKEYIEVTLEDIALANEIAHNLLGHSLDELTEPSRRLLSLIDKMVKEIMKKTSRERNQIHFTRREVREYTKWSDYQVRTHLKQLIDLEYILPISGRHGLQFKYELLYDAVEEGKERFLPGLKNIELLRKEAQTLGLIHNSEGVLVNCEG